MGTGVPAAAPAASRSGFCSSSTPIVTEPRSGFGGEVEGLAVGAPAGAIAGVGTAAFESTVGSRSGKDITKLDLTCFESDTGCISRIQTSLSKLLFRSSGPCCAD